MARRRAYTDTLLAAWNGARASATELRDLVDEVSQADGPRKQLPPQALAAALSSMANKLGAISMAEYRARVWGRK
ncbi:hypothetical protein [Roseicitreum antarcticum]|uniref:hypothetical protein n=1 Tax=Roseicitreum antarcticum TaxID=564137 RepID=UPI0016819081|nr:hypothetical protein [Roseicitreum antarcticum]